MNDKEVKDVDENIDLLMARFYSAAKELSDRNRLDIFTMAGESPDDDSIVMLVLKGAIYNDEVGFLDEKPK
ncbi:MAG: hypothetical protein WA061_02770 [Microgenomates group bacterium]